MATCVQESETASRKNYTDEFKCEAVRLATALGNSMAGVGRDLGVNRTLIGTGSRTPRLASTRWHLALR